MKYRDSSKPYKDNTKGFNMCIRPIRYITYSVFLILGVLFVLFMAAITSNNPPPELAELAGHRELATIIRILFFVSCLYGLLQLFWTALERESQKLQVQLETNLKDALSGSERRKRKERQRKTFVRHKRYKCSSRRHIHFKPISGVRHE